MSFSTRIFLHALVLASTRLHVSKARRAACAHPLLAHIISYPSFKKLLAHSSVDEAAIGELFFELDGNLDGFITEKESRCWRIEKTLPKTWQKGVPSKRSA